MTHDRHLDTTSFDTLVERSPDDEDLTDLGGQQSADVPEWQPLPEEVRTGYWREVYYRNLMHVEVYHEPNRSRGTASWLQSMPPKQDRQFNRWTARLARASRIETPGSRSTRAARNLRYESSSAGESRRDRNARRPSRAKVRGSDGGRYSIGVNN